MKRYSTFITLAVILVALSALAYFIHYLIFRDPHHIFIFMGSDLDHIATDIHRAYARLVAEWLNYMEHLQQDYPFLFSLFVRTNPFQEHPSPLVT